MGVALWLVCLYALGLTTHIWYFMALEPHASPMGVMVLFSTGPALPMAVVLVSAYLHARWEVFGEWSTLQGKLGALGVVSLAVGFPLGAVCLELGRISADTMALSLGVHVTAVVWIHIRAWGDGAMFADKAPAASGANSGDFHAPREWGWHGGWATWLLGGATLLLAVSALSFAGFEVVQTVYSRSEIQWSAPPVLLNSAALLWPAVSFGWLVFRSEEVRRWGDGWPLIAKTSAMLVLLGTLSPSILGSESTSILTLALLIGSQAFHGMCLLPSFTRSDRGGA